MLKVPPQTANNGAAQFSPNMLTISSFQPGIGRQAISRNSEPQMVNGVVMMKPSLTATIALICAKRFITSRNLLNISCLDILKPLSFLFKILFISSPSFILSGLPSYNYNITDRVTILNNSKSSVNGVTGIFLLLVTPLQNTLKKHLINYV